MKTAERFSWFVMPFQWMRRGCFDREAAVIAWMTALGLGPWWNARKLARSQAMKTKRLTERELRNIVRVTVDSEAGICASECLAYRRALRKVRKVMFDEGVDYPAVEAVIDRALGAKR